MEQKDFYKLSNTSATIPFQFSARVETKKRKLPLYPPRIILALYKCKF